MTIPERFTEPPLLWSGELREQSGTWPDAGQWTDLRLINMSADGDNSSLSGDEPEGLAQKVCVNSRKFDQITQKIARRYVCVRGRCCVCVEWALQQQQ